MVEYRRSGLARVFTWALVLIGVAAALLLITLAYALLGPDPFPAD